MSAVKAFHPFYLDRGREAEPARDEEGKRNGCSATRKGVLVQPTPKVRDDDDDDNDDSFNVEDENDDFYSQ